VYRGQIIIKNYQICDLKISYETKDQRKVNISFLGYLIY